ncbi:MAG TPA: hypothetical protein DCZ94_14395 [Lentisphaeria bacterium]|nr:hypothetical protein [Lentisphaeria bacterium]
MCIAVYISSNQTVPVIEWDSNNPAFNIKNIAIDEHHGVEKQFSKKNIYYVGSHEGCGCGFIYDENNPEYQSDPIDLETRKKNVMELVNILKSLLNKSDQIELFICYEGRQGDKPLNQRKLSPDQLLSSSIFADAWDNPQFAIIENIKNSN